jgi:hypothetical protein
VTPLPLGKCVATPGAIEAMREAEISPSSLLDRHRSGDWGQLDSHDRKANQQALIDGSRVFSVYVLPATNVTVWCITESVDDQGERESTCLLLPDEY